MYKDKYNLCYGNGATNLSGMGIQSAVNFLRNFKLGLFSGKGGGGLLDQGLFAFYTLDETIGFRQDCGPNDFEMDASGGAFFTTEGILSNAANFQGTFAKLATFATGGIIDDIRTQSFSACGWVNVDPTITGPGYIFGITQGNMNDDGLFNVFWEDTGDGLVLFLANGAGGFFTGLTINGGTPKNTWIFIAITYDADTNAFNMQINDNQTGTSGTHVITGAPTGQRLLMGSTFDTGVLPFKGNVDNVVYYADTNTPSSVIDFYFKGGGLLKEVVCAHFFNDDATFFNDVSINDVDFTTSNEGANYIVGPKQGGGVNGAIEFDGITGGAISDPSTALDALRENSFTVTLFAMMSSSHVGDANFLSVLSHFGTGGLLFNITYSQASNGVAITLYNNFGFNNDIVFQQIGGGLPRDVWFSIQTTYDSTTGILRLRLNDQAFGQTTLSFPTNVQDGQRLDIGNLLGVSFFLEGAIAEPVIYNRVENDALLNTRYMDGWATRPYNPGQPPCAALLAASLQDGSGNVLQDGSGNILKG